jgi:hypothetical protein
MATTTAIEPRVKKNLLRLFLPFPFATAASLQAGHPAPVHWYDQEAKEVPDFPGFFQPAD